MKQNKIEDHFFRVSTPELIISLGSAHRHLATASVNKPGSEWHETCFLATVAYAQELNRRGVRL